MIKDRDILLSLLRGEARLADLDLHQFDLAIRQARAARLLGWLAVRAQTEGADLKPPPGAASQLLSARHMATAHQRALLWELNRIEDALSGVEHPVILLKGAAYAALGLPNSHGRFYGDIDLMVPREELEAVEDRLKWKGWISNHARGDYDDRYYRRWIHEIPPLRHIKRDTVLDLHHTILPPSSRIKVDTSALFNEVVSIPGQPFFKTLAPEDLILHSAAHLFTEGEFDHGLRDLADLHLLLGHFSTTPDFLNGLAGRARATGLDLPLYYALRYCRLLLRTTLPAGVEDSLNPGHSRFRLGLLDQMFRDAFTAHHPSTHTATRSLSLQALFIRGHYLRMPLRLLTPHLLRKALRRD